MAAQAQERIPVESDATGASDNTGAVHEVLAEERVKWLCARVASRVSCWGPGREGRLDVKQLQANIVRVILDCDLDAVQREAQADPHEIEISRGVA